MRREDLLEKFLNEEGIYVSQKEEIKNNFSIDNCITSITEFHKSIKGKNNYTLGIISEAGKIRQEQLISYKRACALAKEISFDISDLILYSKECIEMISDDDFVKLIQRAYKKSEITLGKVHLNIKSHDEKIFVYDIGRIRFGMVEDDFIKLIRRVKYKDIDCESMIDKFIENEELEELSKIYIKSIVLYPKRIMEYLGDCYIKDFHNEEEIQNKLKDMRKKCDLFRR